MAVELHLSGILWDAVTPMAIINGQTLHVGEKLEGYEVIQILQDHVVLSDGTTTSELLLAP